MKNLIILMFSTFILSCEDHVYVIQEIESIKIDTQYTYKVKYEWNDDSLSTTFSSYARFKKGEIID